MSDSTPVAGPFTYRWDLDKTYIRTDFSGVGALIKAALQKAHEKETVPGAGALMAELRAAHPESRFCFLSGSPTVMRKVLTAKLKLDGIEPDEFVLKPQLRNVVKGRFRAIKEQLGYKLPALLEGRRRTDRTMREMCFGDDAEMDAFIYSLYADILAGKVSTAVLTRVLTRLGVYDDDASRAVGLACAFEPFDTVQRVFIHLDRMLPPSTFEPFGPRVVVLYNYFQAALVMLQDHVIAPDGAVRVLDAMYRRHRYDVARIANSVQDMLRRATIEPTTVQRLCTGLERNADLLGPGSPPAADLLRELERRVTDLAAERAPRTQPERLDFLDLLDRLQPRLQEEAD